MRTQAKQAPPLQGRGWGEASPQAPVSVRLTGPTPNPSPEGEGLKA